MLGLRALLHFDLLRMFGKGNLGGRPELLNTPSIPYSLNFNKYAPVQFTYEQFLGHLKKDIEEAIDYLYVDPITRRESLDYYLPYVDQSFLCSPGFVCPHPNVGRHGRGQGESLDDCRKFDKERLLLLGI